MSEDVTQTTEVSPEPKKAKPVIERSCFGHKIDSPGGFIDECVKAGGLSEKQMLQALCEHTKTSHSIGRIRGHIKHLIMLGATMKVFKGADGTLQHELIEAPKPVEKKSRAKKSNINQAPVAETTTPVQTPAQEVGGESAPVQQ